MKKKPNVEQQLEEITFILLRAKRKLLDIEHSTLCESLRQNRAERKELRKQIENMGVEPF